MNRKQRFESLLAHGSMTEKVLFRPILMQFAAEFIGSNYGAFAADHKVLVAANLACMEAFDLDMIGLISDPYRETSAFGAEVEFVENGVPRCKTTLVSSIESAKALHIPNVKTARRTLDRIKGAELMAKRTQNTVPIIGWVEGPLAEACDLAGVEFMMIQLMMDPDFCNILMDKCLTVAKEFARAQIEAGCDIIGIGDAICSQIDTTRYDVFVKPRHRELVEFIHSQGARVKLHICGDINHLLPSIMEIGVDILDLDYQVSLTFARSILGPKTILCGNINPVDIQNKTPEEVTDHAKCLIEKHRDEAYILSAGCEITPMTPYNNLKALSQARW